MAAWVRAADSNGSVTMVTVGIPRRSRLAWSSKLPAVHEPHRRVTDREDERRIQTALEVVVRLGNCERQDEYRPHRDDERDADESFIGVRLIPQPCER